MSFSFTVGDAVADLAARAAAAGFTIRIHWGDGRNQRIRLADKETQSLTHTYSSAGTFTIMATATDERGRVRDAATHRVAIAATRLMRDPGDRGKMSLFIGGTPGNDSIAVVPAAGGQVQVLINGKSQGHFTVAGALFIHGDAGDDTLSVASTATVPAQLDGGPGNDVLLGGGGNDILLGGPGNDMLFGRAGRNVLVGGGGADMLLAGSNGAILIGGTTAFDAAPMALRSIVAKWTSDRDYRTRVADLRASAGLSAAQGTAKLVTTGPGATVRDDGVSDLLGGGAGRDWFVVVPGAPVKDQIVGRQAGDLIERRRRR